MSDKVIYTVGGTVQASGGIYISRDADEELLRLCREGEFCYVLTARQMGKSSLMVATRERLATEGIHSVEIDLTEMGTELSGLTAEQWYLGSIDLIVDQLDLDVDYMAWWDERAHLGPTQRLSQFLRQVVLEQVSEPVVIFIDEIDSTLNLDFTDDFFAAIRACYNARASDPAFKRLTFVLLGVVTPSDLISDPQRTPFNIGRRMDLTDFTGRQALPLTEGLGLPPMEAGQVLAWILGWTGGHPYLTQRLCAAAATSLTKNWDALAVTKLVEETFLGEQSAQDSNLQFVRDMLTQRAPDKAAVLKTYRRIHAGKTVPDEERSPVKTYLKLSGIAKRKGDNLAIRNEIYRRVFDLAWVRENTAVNWARVVAGIAVFVAVLAVGAILYNFWVEIQSQDCIANFYQANVPGERLAHLAKIFGLRGLFGPTDYDYQARELFYGLSREEQLALFNVNNVVEDSDLIVLTKGLYITLADVDGTDSTRPLLEAMVRALGDLNATEETKELEGEINSWLEGRKLAKQNQYDNALAEYAKAIALNSENAATLYERAMVLTELSEYQQALRDLDQIIAIAGRAPPPTPTASPTDTPAASSPPTTEPTTSPMLTPASTSTPSADMTPSETSPSTSVTVTSASLPIPTEMPIPTATPTPASITSEFATTGQMISAIRNMIYGNPDLVSSLASAPSSAYPNLREFGLVPILTSTPTPTATASLQLTAIGPDFPISQASGRQGVPAIAYNSQNNELLVVWQDDRNAANTNYDIYGQIVSIPGTLQETNFPISMAARDQYFPAIASNTNGEFLVVWQDSRHVSWDIYAQRVSNEGTLLGDELAISIASSDQIFPALAYNSSEDQYLVVWQDHRNGNWDIYGRCIFPEGDQGDSFLIAVAMDSQERPDVVYNSVDNEFLVIWQDYRDANWDIYGRRISGQCSPLGHEFTVSQEPAREWYPALAYNSGEGQCLAVWWDDRDASAAGGDIYGQLLSPEGESLGNNFSISDAQSLQWYPDVVYSSFDNDYLVVWGDNRNSISTAFDIYGQWVTSDGEMRGDNLPISTAPDNQRYPALAYDDLEDQCLVAWQDDRNYEAFGWEIYGTLLIDVP